MKSQSQFQGGEDGPITRRKDNLLNRMNEEVAQNPEYSSLQKFDEYYKNNKNVIHEAYYYKKPRINTLLYQVSPEDLANDINNKTEMRDNGKNY